MAVLGAEVARGLFPTLNPLGQRVRVDGRSFRVVGVLAPKGEVLGQSQDLTVVVPLHTFLNQFGMKRPLSIAAAVDSPDNVIATEDALIGSLRRARRTPPEAQDDFSINRPEQLANTFAQLTKALFGAAIGVGLHHPAGGRHRDHEHHAGERARADPGDRHPAGAGRASAAPSCCSS